MTENNIIIDAIKLIVYLSAYSLLLLLLSCNTIRVSDLTAYYRFLRAVQVSHIILLYCNDAYRYIVTEAFDRHASSRRPNVRIV